MNPSRAFFRTYGAQGKPKILLPTTLSINNGLNRHEIREPNHSSVVNVHILTIVSYINLVDLNPDWVFSVLIF